jgi:type IV pilus assembly protein PilB
VRSRLGECLVEAGLITAGGLQRALAEQASTGERLGLVLTKLGLATESQIAEALARQLGLPFVTLGDQTPDPDVVAILPRELARDQVCMAIARDGDVLRVAMADPLRLGLLQDLEARTGCRVTQALATRSDILAAIARFYIDRDAATEPPTGARRFSGTATAEAASDELARTLVRHARQAGARAVHIEPETDGFTVRHRLDGVLKKVATLIIPDPRALLEDLGVLPDVRVSVLPTLLGERIVLRLLERRQAPPAFDELGMFARSLSIARGFLDRPDGLVLVVGPAGSGLSTTLSSAAATVATGRAGVITIEDPADYRIQSVSQIELSPGQSMASTVQSAVHQDPDVIVVGDLPDAQTARVVIDAARRRLVIVSLQGTDVLTGVLTLAALAGEKRSLLSVLTGAIAQRLVRRLCVHCRERRSPEPRLLTSLALSDDAGESIPFYGAVGCEHCHHTGYSGRIGVFEVVAVTEWMRRCLESRASDAETGDAMRAGGAVSLAEDGLAKVKGGMTSLDELFRVVPDVRQPRALCHACGCAIEVDFAACPACGARLSVACPHCGRGLQPAWNYCPYCTGAVDRQRGWRRSVPF